MNYLNLRIIGILLGIETNPNLPCLVVSLGFYAPLSISLALSFLASTNTETEVGQDVGPKTQTQKSERVINIYFYTMSVAFQQ